jgi:hypothetical protein
VVAVQASLPPVPEPTWRLVAHSSKLLWKLRATVLVRLFVAEGSDAPPVMAVALHNETSGLVSEAGLPVIRDAFLSECTSSTRVTPRCTSTSRGSPSLRRP